MSRTLLSLAGFQVIISGRFWVIAEVSSMAFDFAAIISIAEATGMQSGTFDCKTMNVCGDSLPGPTLSTHHWTNSI